MANRSNDILQLTETLSKTKVLTAKGQPLKMYHGGSFTTGDFKGVGWFTASKADARYYATQTGGVVTTAYLRIEHPLYCGEIEHLCLTPTKEMLNSAMLRNLTQALVIKGGIIIYLETNAAILIAQDIGSDGVIDMRDGEIMDAIIFSHEQLVIVAT